jgi:alpha-beta hydrolase superfamily lysophospholipase
MARVFLTRIALAVIALVMMAVLSGCGRVFFYPQRVLPITPEAAELAWEDVWLRAADGVELHAWYLPAEGEPRGTVLFLHGNGGNVATQLPAVYWLPARGYAVLMPDYRGYGRSEGSVSIAGAILDVQAALSWLARHEPAGKDGVVVLGQSLGSQESAACTSRIAPAIDTDPSERP